MTTADTVGIGIVVVVLVEVVDDAAKDGMETVVEVVEPGDASEQAEKSSRAPTANEMRDRFMETGTVARVSR
ncbi:MAG: hypothetical protein ACN4GK_01465 [Acidimicrobiia bacterium]